MIATKGALLSAGGLRYRFVEDTESGDPYYAAKNLSRAVYVLATGAHDVRYRLRDAYIELAVLWPRDFPEELQTDFARLKRSLTHRRGDKEASVRAITRMRLETGVKLAKKLVELDARLHDILRNQPRRR